MLFMADKENLFFICSNGRISVSPYWFMSKIGFCTLTTMMLKPCQRNRLKTKFFSSGYNLSSMTISDDFLSGLTT